MRATRKLTLGLLMSGAAVCVSAHAQPILWTRLPTIAELDAAYPEKARAAGTSGHAWVECDLTRAGRLKRCETAAESQREYGFGESALTLTAMMQAEPRTEGPAAVRIMLPIHLGPPTPDRPIRPSVFQTKDGQFNIASARWRNLAPIGPYWPDYALRIGLAGMATLDCRVDDSQRLLNCAMVGEGTTHPMFGYAALAMAQRNWMTAGAPPTHVVPPSDGIWRIQIDFPKRTLKDIR